MSTLMCSGNVQVRLGQGIHNDKFAEGKEPYWLPKTVSKISLTLQPL